MANAIETTLRFIHSIRWEDLPLSVQRQSKRCLLDSLGALLAGTHTPVAKLTTIFVQSQFGTGEATILGEGNRRTSLVGAALANGTAGNALDIDDGYRQVKGHPGACVLPIALAAGEATGCSGKAFLSALVTGYEIGIRAGLMRHHLSADYHSSGSWGAIAGTAVACKLFGYDVETTRQALGIAEYHAPIALMMKGIATPSMGKDSIGWGCLVAMSSALMAKEGFTGVDSMFSHPPVPDWILSLGEQYKILNLYFKPYAACRWAQPAVEGALSILQKHNLSAQDICSITVKTFSEAAVLSQSYPQTTEAAQYNLPFPLAAAILDGEVGPKQVLPPRLFDSDIRSMMDRITVVAEDRFQAEFPAKTLAEVSISTFDGKTFESGVSSALWDADFEAPSDKALSDKFKWLATPIVGEATVEAIAAEVWTFEDCTTVRSLIEKCI